FSGGRLKTSVTGLGEFLPLNDTATFPNGTLPMRNDTRFVPDDELFAAGDVRANEGLALVALHTLFVREHNRLANAYHAQNSSFSDETLYQLARRMVAAEIQAITYNEFIPALLGANALPAYTGYKPNVNPNIAQEFSGLFSFFYSMYGDRVG